MPDLFPAQNPPQNSPGQTVPCPRSCSPSLPLFLSVPGKSPLRRNDASRDFSSKKKATEKDPESQRTSRCALHHASFPGPAAGFLLLLDRSAPHTTIPGRHGMNASLVHSRAPFPGSRCKSGTDPAAVIGDNVCSKATALNNARGGKAQTEDDPRVGRPTCLLLFWPHPRVPFGLLLFPDRASHVSGSRPDSTDVSPKNGETYPPAGASQLCSIPSQGDTS